MSVSVNIHHADCSIAFRYPKAIFAISIAFLSSTFGNETPLLCFGLLFISFIFLSFLLLDKIIRVLKSRQRIYIEFHGEQMGERRTFGQKRGKPAIHRVSEPGGNFLLSVQVYC